MPSAIFHMVPPLCNISSTKCAAASPSMKTTLSSLSKSDESEHELLPRCEQMEVENQFVFDTGGSAVILPKKFRSYLLYTSLTSHLLQLSRRFADGYHDKSGKGATFCF